MNHLAPVIGMFVALALAPQVARAYELQSTDDGGDLLQWRTDTVAFRIDPALGRAFGDAEFRAALEGACAAWSGLKNVPRLKVSDWPASPYVEAVNRGNGVYLVHDWPWKRFAMANTLTSYNSATGEMLQADIMVNADMLDELALEPDAEHYDLQSVLTHELGHALGMLHTTHARSDTMWPTGFLGDLSHRTLEADDIEGVEALYARINSDDFAESLGCQVTVVGAAGSPLSALLFLLLITLWFFWMRRRGQ